MRSKVRLFMAAVAGLLGCGDGGDSGGGEGSLSVLLEAEDAVTDGIPSSSGAGIRDGWRVDFSHYIVAIGPIELASATDTDKTRSADEVQVVDLVALPAGGTELWSFEGLSAGRWQFSYTLARAGEDALRHASVSEADFAAMQAERLTYLVEGELSMEDGQSCPPAGLAQVEGKTPNGQQNGRGEDCYEQPKVSFRFAAAAETPVGPCEIDETPGVSIPASGSQTAAVSIHGDHLFFNGFPEGDEGGVMRLAQWLADCDLDLDGAVTEDELRDIIPADLAEFDTRFQLGAAPIPLETMWDYVVAQLKTQAHFQGEGECPLRR